MTEDTTTPRRRDFTRNRSAILGSAERLSAEFGPDVSVHAVARAAGVAVGTVYRHWPTKEHLWHAVLMRRLDRVAADAEQAASLGAFLDAVTGLCVRDRTLLQLLDRTATTTAGADVATGTRDRLDAAVATLIDRAQRCGELRTAIAPRDLRFYLVGLRAALESDDPDSWRRLHAVYRSGLLTTDPPDSGCGAGNSRRCSTCCAAGRGAGPERT